MTLVSKFVVFLHLLGYWYHISVFYLKWWEVIYMGLLYILPVSGGYSAGTLLQWCKDPSTYSMHSSNQGYNWLSQESRFLNRHVNRKPGFFNEGVGIRENLI